MNTLSFIWPEKYRPKTFSDYKFQNDEHRSSFQSMIDKKDIPHLLLSGGPGTGKTALVQLLIDHCIDPEFKDTDVLKLNASDDNSVDNIRNEVHSFITSMGFGGFKIVWLEEADYLSQNAQGVLRDYMETYQHDVRFILTCNAVHKIVPAIRSRCERYNFKAIDRIDAEEMAAIILKSENVKFTMKTLEAHVAQNYPDMRAVINSLSAGSRSGILQEPQQNNLAGDVFSNIVDAMIIDDWDTILQIVQTSVVDDEWESVYELLYDNLHNCPKFNHKTNKELWGEGIVLIATHLLQHNNHAKPHINGAALIIQLQYLSK